MAQADHPLGVRPKRAAAVRDRGARRAAGTGRAPRGRHRIRGGPVNAGTAAPGAGAAARLAPPPRRCRPCVGTRLGAGEQ
ncbi:hypothetical protein GCM10009605_01350 [Nocardiopsis composta]